MRVAVRCTPPARRRIPRRRAAGAPVRRLSTRRRVGACGAQGRSVGRKSAHRGGNSHCDRRHVGGDGCHRDARAERGRISFSLSSCADAGTPDDVTRCQQNRAQQDAATRANANGTPNVALLVSGLVFLVGGFVLSAYDTTTVAHTTPPEVPRRTPELRGAGWSAPKPKIATSLVVLHF